MLLNKKIKNKAIDSDNLNMYVSLVYQLLQMVSREAFLIKLVTGEITMMMDGHHSLQLY